MAKAQKPVLKLGSTVKWSGKLFKIIGVAKGHINIYNPKLGAHQVTSAFVKKAITKKC